MASLAFVDSHVHHWDLAHPNLRYIWLDPDWVHPVLGNIDAVKTPLFTADEYLAETRFHNVIKTIHVQAAIGIADPVAETSWLQAQTNRTGFPTGIVGHCDLAAADASEILDRHLEYPAFRGVRDFGFGDFISNRAWRRGYGQLAERKLVFCADARPDQMQNARRLADLYPEIVFCLDHAGSPGKSDYETWLRGMKEMAGAPNVVCKISGLGMAAPRWTVESIGRWVSVCLTEFGVERCFFGTNWPVDRLYSSFGDVVDAYGMLIGELTPSEQTALFHTNAERIFRI